MRTRWIAALCCAGVLAPATTASAASSCAYNATTSTATVTVDAFAWLVVKTAGAIYGGEGHQNQCGTATVTNTDTIVVNDPSGAGTIRIELSGGPFAPGDTLESRGPMLGNRPTSEIEFDIDMGDGNEDTILIGGTSAADDIKIGDGGINLNAGDEPQILDPADADIEAPAGVEKVWFQEPFSDTNLSADLVTGAGGEGTGNPTVGVVQLEGARGNDQLTGSMNQDFLNGGPGDDTLVGGTENDELFPDSGNDSVQGGDGTDTAMFGNSAGVGVRVDLGITVPQDTNAGVKTITGIENLEGSSEPDHLIGNAGPNRITGNGFANINAPDVLDGGPGTAAGDVFDGLLPGALVSYESATSAVSVNLTNTATQNTGGGGNDRLLNITGVRGGPGNDTLIGTPQENIIQGGPGDDVLNPGADAGLAQFKNDTIAGGAGVDTATYAAAPGAVSVRLGAPNPQNIGAAGGNDTITGVESLTGSLFGDTLIGDGAANVLNGNEGDDTITGLGGPDTITGANGSDTLDVRDGVADNATCGGGIDAPVVADLLGVDTIAGDCETVAFLPGPPLPPPPAAAGGGGTASVVGGLAGGAIIGAVRSARLAVTRVTNRRDGSLQLQITLPGPGTLDASATASGASGRRAAAAQRRRTLTVARRRFTVRRAGTVTITLKPSRAAKRIITRRRRLAARLTVSFTPTGGRATRITRAVTFRRPARR